MLGDILVQILGEATLGRLDPSRRTQALVRIFFGLLGTLLGLFGAFHFIAAVETSNQVMHASMVAVFVFVSLFSLLNVVFRLPWRWPGLGIVVGFVSLFLSRILLGP